MTISNDLISHKTFKAPRAEW